MNSLYVLYDERCAICKRLKDWLLVQRSWIGLSMIASGSARAKTMFPGLEQVAGANDLVVISDAGEVYLNTQAWLMCLYALIVYGDGAGRLPIPLLLPLARQAFETLSKNRQAISRWIGSNDHDVARELSGVSLEACPSEAVGKETSEHENSMSEYFRLRPHIQPS